MTKIVVSFIKKNCIGFFVCLIFFGISSFIVLANKTNKIRKFNAQELILNHLSDAYDWCIFPVGQKFIIIHLPIIVKGKTSGWHVFSSARFCHEKKSYKRFSIAKTGNYKGKIVEKLSSGVEVRPLDFSLTKNAFSLLLSSALLIGMILFCASWYKKREKNLQNVSPQGFVAFIEWIITGLVYGLVKPCIGKDYKRYTPYLLTVFFFIMINNLLGLIPFFPGGANVTGNIAVSSVLALFTFLAVNLFGTKEYWKEIFCPDIPIWLKIPVPIMSIIELAGVFTKPLALLIRLFANVLAGHAIVLGLTCMIFLTISLGVVINVEMTVLSVLMTLFINCVEILLAYIQAYVFTMLSAVFIGFSQVGKSSCPTQKIRNKK